MPIKDGLPMTVQRRHKLHAWINVYMYVSFEDVLEV